METLKIICLGLFGLPLIAVVSMCLWFGMISIIAELTHWLEGRNK
jgi:hypothetical protein|tara:strand:- start:573 stop:707 length:135 start_codon:yes stop_codon:yes gene_type:complete